MSGLKVTRQDPARILPSPLEVAGVVDGDNEDWDTGPLDAGVVPEHTYELANEGGDPLVDAHGNFGTTETIDPTLGNVHTGTLDDDCTVTLSSPSGDAGSLLLWLTQDGTGGRDTTWAGSVTEVGTPDTTADVTNLAVASTVDGGSSWVVAWIGGGGSGGTPATTVTDETTFGITPAVGTDTEYARQDHTHGSPDTDAVKDAGRWELAVITGSPPDPLYADGDFLYIWVP